MDKALYDIDEHSFLTTTECCIAIQILVRLQFSVVFIL